MEYFLICLISFLASGLTLFSGFGLGTILMPVLVLFFPLEMAIAMTAVVHLFNNFLKLSLLGKYADKKIVLRFGLPALVAAFVGAKVLLWLGDLEPITHYQLAQKEFFITPIKLIISILIIIFALLELTPRFQKMTFPKKYLSLGGILSGFFGGLSGHQGALRSIFLIKSGLSKENFIGTGVVIACLVDLSRIVIYTPYILSGHLNQYFLILFLAIISAFLGTFIGNRLVKKVTLKALQAIVFGLLFIIAVLLSGGII